MNLPSRYGSTNQITPQLAWFQRLWSPRLLPSTKESEWSRYRELYTQQLVQIHQMDSPLLNSKPSTKWRTFVCLANIYIFHSWNEPVPPWLGVASVASISCVFRPFAAQKLGLESLSMQAKIRAKAFANTKQCLLGKLSYNILSLMQVIFYQTTDIHTFDECK